MKIPTHPIASRLSVGFDKLLVSVKGTFHKENSTKDFGLTQRSNAVQQTPSAKIRAAEGFHPIVNFQQHNHHRSIAKD
ncbi:MAG: hypothetical protein JGK24_03350 [Microcoleus sp. PH2017_29_MFU_D_A]|uniref:hypothetical protein n=1 Tax=unclassified Microcoleus TaxID=2642155 RepID=UPI001DAC6CBB|nr:MULTISPECIES: hypothetical protein [unclassified Microcoleus]MCC3425146.1 hypothetical protein [Microcoleus sp. PH2017_01_SCD_O_A]MCC3454810.1 hypothetical protein [Microcoleus sp. PH2017_08_TRC_O_A]MCC3588588.1 hypothetical protein [Microcoleus sp. PH2017_30_WIL_O_A]MCC3602284.1 hypothetical protein [Microcoleus sp. PH2017_29_MFU_D_A]MCC3635898.1 hypothetical protein [Microcoleus sp. PH2017_37_MFU_D_B]